MIGVSRRSRQPAPLESDARDTRSSGWNGIDPGAPLVPGKSSATSDHLVLELPHTSQAPGIARRWVDKSFAEELDDDAQHTAKVLVSELVTNAVVHGRGTPEIHAQLGRDVLLVEVIDEGPGFTPTVREPHPDTVGGNGFRIVEEEARRWGIRDGAAHVWFELPRHAQRADRATSGPISDTQRPGQEPKETRRIHPPRR